MSCIHFKFKSSLEYDKITFDGLHISLGDLKEAIMKQRKIGLSNQYTLRVVDAQSKKVYEGDSEMLPRNTSVIISRVPLVNAPKIPKTQHKDPTLLPQPDTSQLPQSSSSLESKKLTAEELRKTADLANADATEEEKLMAVISQSGEGFDPSQYAKVAPGRSSGGGVPPGFMKHPPPPTYICYRCGQRGHWIKLCPTNGDPKYDNYRYKRSMGTPTSQIVAATNNIPGAMLDRHGNLVVRQVDLNAFIHAKQAKAMENSQSKKELETPPELICHICKKLMKDAVIIPCCGESFCYDCIQDYLCENEFTCPICKKDNVSPDNLAPNKALRTAAKNFQMKASEHKSVAMARGFVPIVPQVMPQPTPLASKGMNSLGPATTGDSLPHKTPGSNSTTPSLNATTATSGVGDATSSSSSEVATSSTLSEAVSSESQSIENSVPSEDSQATKDSEKESEKAGVASEEKPMAEETGAPGVHLNVPVSEQKRSRSRSPSPSSSPARKKSSSPKPPSTATEAKVDSAAKEFLDRISSKPKQPITVSSAPTISTPILLGGKSSMLPQPLPAPLGPAGILGIPHPMPAIPGLPHLPVIQANLVNPLSRPTAPVAPPPANVPVCTEQSSGDITKLERIAAELLLSSATAVSKKSTSPPPLTAEEFYRRQKFLKQITKKQKRQQSESSGTHSRSSISYSRSATPSSTYSSDASRSRSVSRSRSTSRSSYSSLSRSRSRSPQYSSLKGHHSHRSKQHRRHRRDREREKKQRHRYKTKRHESVVQTKSKTGKRSRKHRSRSRSPARKKYRVENSSDLSPLATATEMVDIDTPPTEKTHRRKHKKKDKRKHRHRRREGVEVEEEAGGEGSMEQIGDQEAVKIQGDGAADSVDKESASVVEGETAVQPESESVAQSVDHDKVETMVSDSAKDHTAEEATPSTSQEDPTTAITDPAVDLEIAPTKVDLVSYQDSSAPEADLPTTDPQSVDSSTDITAKEYLPSVSEETPREDEDTLLENEESMMIVVHAEDPIDECSAELLDSECTQSGNNPPGKEEGEISDSEGEGSTETEMKEKGVPQKPRLSEALEARLGDPPLLSPVDNPLQDFVTPQVEPDEDELAEIEILKQELHNAKQLLKSIPHLANNDVFKDKPKKRSKPKSVASALVPLHLAAAQYDGSGLENATGERSFEEDSSSDSSSEEEEMVPAKSFKSRPMKQHSGSSRKHKRKHSSSSSKHVHKEKEHRRERKRKRPKEEKSYKSVKKAKSSKVREKEHEKEKAKKRKKHKKH